MSKRHLHLASWVHIKNFFQKHRMNFLWTLFPKKCVLKTYLRVYKHPKNAYMKHRMIEWASIVFICVTLIFPLDLSWENWPRQCSGAQSSARDLDIEPRHAFFAFIATMIWYIEVIWRKSWMSDNESTSKLSRSVIFPEKENIVFWNIILQNLYPVTKQANLLEVFFLKKEIWYFETLL